MVYYSLLFLESFNVTTSNATAYVEAIMNDL
jgi:hypothetical protein